jgi:PAS domain S-box-containing protein
MSFMEDQPDLPIPLLFEAHPQAALLFDRATLQVVAVNEAAVRVYGYSREEFLAMTVADFRPREDVPLLLELAGQPVVPDSPSILSRHRRKDGSLIEVAIVAADLHVGGRALRLALTRDVTQERRAEAVQRFLARAGAVLASTLDVNATLRELANLAVPVLADYCTIHLLGPDDRLRQVAGAHRDPERDQLVQEMAALHSRALDDPISVFARVARTGVGELFAEAREDGMLSGRGGEPLMALTRQLGPKSYVIAPMVGRHGAVGVLQLTQAESGRRFGPPDLELANELGRRAGMALENALLYETVRDELDQRRRAEAALRRSETRFRAIFESSPHGMMMLDGLGRITATNPAAARLLGELPVPVGQDVLTYSHPEDAEAERPRLADLLAGRIDHYELDLRLATAAEQPILAHASTFRVDPPGSPQPLLVRRLEDVTERRRSEEAIARLAVIAEASHEAIFGIAPDGVITSWNAGAERIFGYAAGEIVGRHFFMMVPPERQAAANLHVQRALTGERIFSFTTPRRKDGSLANMAATLSPIRDRTGKVVAIGYVGHDESERFALEEQLQQAQRMEAVGRLAGGVAHDFNNILTGVKGHSAFLLQALAENDPRRAEVEEIDRAADRAASLTRQLLAFGRRQVLQPRVLEVNVAVREMEGMLRRVIGENVHLTTMLAKDAGAVRADPGQLQQVVLNLVVNARDAMPGGGELRIATECVTVDGDPAPGDLPPGRYAALSVCDAGVGIAPDVLPHIFEPFFTTKDAASGTGLGLATVYGIVSQSGGTVRVESEPERGSTFRVLLPRLEPLAEPVPEPAPRLDGVAPESGREIILLVEDEEPVRHVAGRTLRAGGYTVLTAADGEQALALAQQHETIDLLLSDVVLPGIGGRVIAERLRALRPGLPVLFVSGYAEDAVLRDGRLERGMHFLEKPFSPSELRRKVREVLDEV